MKKGNLVNYVLWATTTASVIILSQLVIPTPFGIPITLQTFIFALCGFVFGARGGIIISTLYILMGAIGLPVFSGFRGGMGCIFGDLTGGFIVGFIPLSAICGVKQFIYYKRNGRALSLLLGYLGVTLCHICGSAFYSTITSIPFLESAVIVSLPFVIKDFIFVTVAYFLSGKIIKILKKAGFQA